MNEYEKQANDFLEKTGTIFKAEYLRNDFHFAGDKDKRDIYKITLSRGSRSYSFEFGQSIANSTYKVVGRTFTGDEMSKCLNKQGKIEMYKFRQFYYPITASEWSNIKYPNKPNAYDVLACLTKYDPGTFEDFCDEFGYDTDSRTAEKVYKAVCDEYKSICALYSNSELELMAEIQ